MRTIPQIKQKELADKIAAEKIAKISRILAIVFISVVQLAIIFKMLF